MGDQRKLFEFTDIGRTEPEKQVIEVRKVEFNEIYRTFEQPNIREQASRCISCGNPYCQWKCPLHNYIPDWLDLAAEGKFVQAAELAHQTNSLPEVCGRVCPQDRLCEQACTINTGFGAVTIGQIEKFITDNAFAQGWRPDLSHVKPQPYKVAVVGAGPAGIGCADVLIRQGVQVTVFDRNPEIGGLLTFGIPEFKLEKQIMAKRREVLVGMGIEFQLNTEIGKDISYEQLNSDFDAVFLGLGAYQPVDSGLGEGNVPGVFRALDFLIGNTCQLHGWQQADYPYIDLSGKAVVVLGGGDTAMDCVRTAIRQGARKVTCVYRKDAMAMPGSRKEYQHATEEGVEFAWHHQATELVFNEDKEVVGIQCDHTQYRQPAEVIDCDSVIVAYGFRPSPPEWLKNAAIELDSGYRVATDEAKGFRTTVNRVYAGGDMVRGADLVVTAIADGRKAAEAICEDLGVVV